jgi:HEAT repeat protein
MHREEALAALQKLQDPRLAWQDRASLRRRIIDAAGSLVPELSQAVEGADDVGFRNELLGIIGASGEEAFEAPLLRLLNDADVPVEVRQTAATNLGKLGSSGSFALLTDLLGYPSPHVRLGAIYGLAALGEARAVPHLAKLLDDGTPVKVWWAGPKAGGYVIAREAAQAIDQLTGRAFTGDQALVAKWIRAHLDEDSAAPQDSPS